VSEITTFDAKLHSHRTLLCLLGQKCQDEQLLAPLHNLVKIRQKTLVHTPTQKLQDCLLAILCGSEAVSQINTTVAADVALQRAWGRERCADQASVQDTLSAISWQNLVELRQALSQIFNKYSRAAHHDFTTGPLILDVDMTGLPCSKHYQGAEAGYFAGCKKGTTGRQLARVSASQYDEIVYEQIFPGNTPCMDLAVFKQLLEGALAVLGLAGIAKGQILIRLDGGYGTSEIINYLLAEGYQFVVKLYNGLRARKLGRAVAEEDWQSDSCHGRSWALLADDTFYQTEKGGRPLHQIAVRCLSEPKTKSKGKVKASKPGKVTAGDGEVAIPCPYSYSVLIVSRETLGVKPEAELASVGEQLHFYDGRATIESASFRGDKQGLKLVKRRKVSLCGQEALVLLSQLAHNLLAWARSWLSAHEERLGEYGTKRWVRDLLTIPGRVNFKAGRIVKVRMSKGHRLAKRFFEAFARFFSQIGIRLILCET
jgi:hypothetical protein